MATEAGVIFPDTGVIDNQRIVDAVFGVIDLLRRVGVDHLDRITVDYQGIFAFENANSAFKGTVHRVAPQQSCTLFQIVIILTLANNNSAQAQHITTTGFIH